MSNTKPKSKVVPSTKNTTSAIETERANYKITLKYSDEAIEKDLVKFTAKSKKMTKEIEFVMSLSEIAEMVIQHLNTELLSIINSKIKTIPMVKVIRTISGTATQDFKKGDPISFNFPVETTYEMALAEQALNLARIDGKVEQFPAKYMKKAREAIDEKTKEYASIVYASVLNEQKNNSSKEETVSEEKAESAT